jgi:hypothetical protein
MGRGSWKLSGVLTPEYAGGLQAPAGLTWLLLDPSGVSTGHVCALVQPWLGPLSGDRCRGHIICET